MAEKKIVLCDTNVFIDYFHEDERIVRELDHLGFERFGGQYCPLCKSGRCRITQPLAGSIATQQTILVGGTLQLP